MIDSPLGPRSRQAPRELIRWQVSSESKGIADKAVTPRAVVES